MAMLFDQEILPIDITYLQPPPKNTVAMLLRIYQDRVDKLVKVLHWGTVQDAIERSHAAGKSEVQSPAMQALAYAIYFISICSITDDEADTMMLGDRGSLIQQYRHATEILISKADLYRNPDLVVLQAFVIYLVSYAQQLTLLLADHHVGGPSRMQEYRGDVGSDGRCN